MSRAESVCLAAIFVVLLSLPAGCGPGRAGSPQTPVVAESSATTPRMEIRLVPALDDRQAFEVDVPDELLDDWLTGDHEDVSWTGLFAVFVEDAGVSATHDPPPMVGDYRANEGVLQFVPRYPLEPGVTYRAVFRTSQVAATEWQREDIQSRFRLPPRLAMPTTVVRRVYPSLDVLPENQLKFYIHFSSPMSQGEAYGHIHLFDDSGREVEDPFLELGEELWDRSGTRFTLFLDPGRQKRELKPREELGPSLLAGQRYTLRVDASWRDASGVQLAQAHGKEFRVGPADFEPPDTKTWKLESPPRETRKALVVAFPEPLDHALLQPLLWITHSRGEPLDGNVEVTDGERRWSFTPEAAWRPGEYRLVTQTVLEDLAGNSIGRPFEVDIFRKVRRRIEVEEVAVKFAVD